MLDDNHGRDEEGHDVGGGNGNGNGDNAPSKDHRPLFMRVRDGLIERIQSGVWKPGQIIPSEHEIAREFDVSQGTARRALMMLVELGFLSRRQGSGTWVQDDTPAVRYRFFSFYDKDGVQDHA